ncbi:hypothetical protein ACMU_08700 [Actibacterium mucosum KCTC 23349]|uniref:Stringent starvation protein B n=1 Tax=Actibacterium mucosum KCTC 23349 TaxID=1454373 RepID=A0A037ZJW5_9RHOB|nr:ClpXP protease specificity-enhancing factor SspB [Actibacterium mucosum]KAJ55842.1 hypothetical protein ACMU_08700 [Actibacterium mucosum KCTC 23349]
MTQSIEYGNLMHKAMRGLIREVLADVADHGLPGLHHFFVTFDTTHPEVDIADWLRDRYPDEMTVVMQHRFDDLEVTEDGFAVTLSFGDSPERLSIPFTSIRTFVDPSVEFGLRFETQDGDDEEEAALTAVEDPVEDAPEEDEAEHKDAEIVSLDSFRK